MILNAIKYTRFAGEPREWNIVGKDGSYARFDNINLLVGKNASGKSRTLNIIREIAGFLSGKSDLSRALSPSECFELIFTGKELEYRYKLVTKDRKVVEESLSRNGKTVLDRSNNTLSDASGNTVSYNVQPQALAVTLCDSDNKPYFIDLVEWGNALKNYLFANQFEKNKQVKDYTRIDGGDPGIEGTEILIYTFYRGTEFFGDTFINEILSDMRELGYAITDISIKENDGTYGLCIEEDGEYSVSQRDMSQGMFRALSLLIMLTYARLSELSLCILIDDMGEGLDFESSRKMMNIVIKRINNSNLQFFMTTNDRYVMNHIPLRFWTVIDREESSRSVFYDYENSKENFEDFKYTGLNNFDFLTTDFFRNGFGEIEEEEDND